MFRSIRKPVEPIPFLYGGGTRASVRRAVQYCDGWIAGRVPMATFDDRIALLKSLADEAGKDMIVVNIPVMSIDKDRAKARSRIDVNALAGSSTANKFWIKPASGAFSEIEDLEGLAVVGTPKECIEEIQKFKQRGIDHFVFDLRLQYDVFVDSLNLIAEEVLPYL